MKIAISGKGGVGKTLLASLLSGIFAEAGYSVLAIDADPDSNLAATLGFPDADDITPISEMSALIEERTGAPAGQTGGFFSISRTCSKCKGTGEVILDPCEDCYGTGRQEKISTSFPTITDLIQEADYWAGQENRSSR